MPNRTYERIKDGKVEICPTFDPDGKVTGKIVVGVREYFDENPEEARRLGWTKHISYSSKELREMYDWDPRSQYLKRSLRQVDEWTVEDVYHVMDKSEEQMLNEEMGQLATSLVDVDVLYFGEEW